MSSIISSFHIDWHIIIAQVFNFAVVFLVLYFFAIKPLNKLMTERANKINKGIEDAKTYSVLVEKTKEECNIVLNKAHADVSEILKKETNVIEEKKIKMLEQTKDEIASMRDEAKRNLEIERIKMFSDVKKDIASLVMQVTEKLIGEKPDKVLAEQYVKKINDLQNIK